MSKEITLAYIKDIAARINNPSIYGGASLMVGAGFSKNAEGIGNRNTPPDWSELAQAMYDELYIKPCDEDRIKEWTEQRIIKTSGKNTLHLAEEYIAFFGRNKMDALIEKNVADEMFVPGELHKRLLRLNWKDIFTTNYDTLLERTREEILPDKEYLTILSQDNLPGTGGSKSRIIKLHGSIPGVRPYIISEEDFRLYPQKSAAFVNTVQQALIETTLCMVGFSGDDPNFLSWHGWLLDNLGENCPQVYLIGLFGNMKESEKDIFRRRRIALVDLENLLEGNEKNKYAEAYCKFISLIEAEAQEERFEDRAPYQKSPDFRKWSKEKEDEYISKILAFSDEILNQIRDVVLLPNSIRDKYRNYFVEHFDNVIYRCKHVNKNFVHVLSNLIKIQRLCLIPLYDNQANKLKEVCDCVREEKMQVSKEWIFQIYLYLLEMYRIDADKEAYKRICSACEALIGELPETDQGFYRIELAKNAMGYFDAEEVKKQLDCIGQVGIKSKIAKAGLYIQIGENEIAENLLKECLNDLGNLKLDSDMNASYKSYLSLCFTTLNKWWNRDDDYSDAEYRGNRWQTRKIILDIEENLREEILKSNVKEDTRENIFEVNHSRGETVIIGDNKLQRISFEFVLMLDMLCLPLFMDQSLLLPSAIQNIIESSPNPFWKLSFMLCANSKEVIERVLSRRSIAMYDREVLEEIYNNVWSCMIKTIYKNSVYRHAFFSQVNCLNILSRIVVYMDDKRIVKLIQYLAKMRFEKDDHTIIEIRGIISRISTRFNNIVGNETQRDIFIEADSRLWLASYFTQIDMIICDVDKYYEHALELASKESFDDRDNGIAELLCLWRNCQNKKYEKCIEEVIWENKKGKFPRTRMFYEMIWEELPHPDVNFSELYKAYIYDGIVNHASDRDLFRYVNLLYLASPMSDGEYSLIDIDDEFVKDILTSVEKVVNSKEENNSGIDFGNEQTDRRQMRNINELITILYVISIDELNSVEIGTKIKHIMELMKKKGFRCFAIEVVNSALEHDYERAVDMIKPAFWSNEETILSEISLSLQSLLFIAKRKMDDLAVIKETVIEVMEKLQYADIKYVKTMWNFLRQPILRTFSEDASIQSRLAQVFADCLKSYSFKGLKGDKYYFEAMYNCNKTLKSYCEEIKNNGIEPDVSINNVIAYIKSLNVPELSTVWS